MKLQSFGIIFVLIFLPLVLVLSYYIQLQVETIRIQNEYDNKLLSSTYDAMSAFELNTANEDLSSVSDSLRTIIEASCNVFFNSLATNLGMSNASKSYIEPYVPALLYTLYDGYYIYAPTSVPTVLTDEDGNALSVGDPGVIKNGANYGYDPNQTATLEYNNLNNSQKSDYGQLLYEMNSGNSYTTNPDDAKYKTKNVLKTYMPYSAKYYQNNVNGKEVNIEVIYTLDNYVTIEGTVGDIYYTKSGYLIPTNKIGIETKKADGSPVTTEDNKEINILSYNENDAEKYISDGNPIQIKIDSDIEIVTNGDNKKTKDYEEEIISYKTNIETAEDYIVQLPILNDTSIDQTLRNSLQAEIEAFINSITKEDGTAYNIANGLSNVLNEIILDRTNMINDRQYEVDTRSAAIYYVKAYIFSVWVEETFVSDTPTNPARGLMEKSLIQVSSYISMEDAQNTTQLGIGTTEGMEEIQYNFADKTSNVFDVTNAETSYKSMAATEIPQDSAFYTHKSNVIRSSIQYNLNLAMTNYNYNKAAYDAYNMPVISEDEWRQLLSNVSLISFMQGYSCGLKTYNNYMFVSSTNNEISVSPSSIYYLSKVAFNDETTEYHRIDCKKFVESSITPKVNQFLTFVSKEVKYDKLYDKTRTFLPYEYDHKNLACYDCINDGNYEKINPFDNTYVNYSNCDELRKAYYIAIGKSRNNLYKMNAITQSQGYKVWSNNIPLPTGEMTKTIDLTKIKALEFVFGTVKFTDSNETAVRFEILLDDGTDRKIHEADFSISQTANKTTVYVPIKTNLFDVNEVANGKIISLNDLFFKNLAAISSIVVEQPDGTTAPMELNNLLHNEAPSEVLEYVRVIYK